MRDRLRLRGIISDESQNLFLAFAERGNFSQHRLALVPRILLMPSTFSTLSACGADGRSSVPNGCRGRANISTHSVSCGNAYVRRNGGDRYVDSNCFDEN